MKKFALWILASIWLWIWTIFAQSIPDSVEISVKDPLIVWEATNLKITMMKNGSKMTTYNWTIRISVTDENGKIKMIRNKKGMNFLYRNTRFERRWWKTYLKTINPCY